MISEALALLFSILTAHHKYSLCDQEKWQQSIQMQLSKQQKIISNFFALFLKFPLIFEHFLKQYDPHSSFISEITDCKGLG